MHYLLPQPKRQPTRRQAMKRCLLRAVFAKSFPSSQSALDLNHTSASVFGGLQHQYYQPQYFFFNLMQKSRKLWKSYRRLTLRTSPSVNLHSGGENNSRILRLERFLMVRCVMTGSTLHLKERRRGKKTGLFRSLLCGGPLIPLWRATKSYWYVGRRKENAEVWSPQRAVGRVLTMCCNDFTFKGDK